MTEGCPMPTSPVLCAMAIFLRLHLPAASLQISCMAGLRMGPHLALAFAPIHNIAVPAIYADPSVVPILCTVLQYIPAC